MINFLKQYLPGCDVLIHYEKKIDVNGIGDSILGHFDEETQEDQLKSGKFLIRVANMVGATACAFQTMPLQAAMCCCVSQKKRK